MAERMRPPPPGASSDGLFACLRALAEEARSLGLAEAASMIDLAAECVAVEAEERGLCLDGPVARPRGIRLG
jgi:hypothetical protein